MSKCGVCNGSFTYDEYLAHVCVTGYTPLQPQHLGRRFLLQSKKALERTGSLKKAKEKEIDEQIEEVKEKGVDRILSDARAANKKAT